MRREWVNIAILHARCITAGVLSTSNPPSFGKHINILPSFKSLYRDNEFFFFGKEIISYISLWLTKKKSYIWAHR